ncbi:MAG: Na(+)/H(+) antiporter subunit B [Bacteroidales bacterium]|nr:Na(+)/H(+) antiporter subunit B [Bacteroidales bacterium]
MAARYLKPMLLILSLYVLYRGHNVPGGGFIGGLMAASGYILYMMAFGAKATVEQMWIKPFALMALGLTVALTSGFFGPLIGELFMAGQWISVLGVKLGTPTLFDVGVYLTVIAVILVIMIAIFENLETWN